MRNLVLTIVILINCFSGYSQSEEDSVLLVFKGIPYEIKFRGYYTLSELVGEESRATTYEMKVPKSTYDYIFEGGGLEKELDNPYFDTRAIAYFYYKNEFKYLIINAGLFVRYDGTKYRPSLRLYKFLDGLPKPTIDKYEGR